MRLLFVTVVDRAWRFAERHRGRSLQLGQQSSGGISGEAFAGIFDSDQDSYVLYLDKANNELRFKVTDLDGTAERPGIAAADLDSTRWHHIAGVYDGATGKAFIYMDGVLKDTHVNAAQLMDAYKKAHPKA